MIFLIFPVQLFEYKILIKTLNEYKCDKIFIIEDDVYFTKYNFHKIKLVFHRASMRSYYHYLQNKNLQNKNLQNKNLQNKTLQNKNLSIEYYEFNSNYINDLKGKNIKVFMYDPVDKDIINKLKNINITILETPEFISTSKNLEEYYKSHKEKKFMHDSSFYKWQLSKIEFPKNIANSLDKTHDKENRLPFPTSQKEVFNPQYNKSKYVEEAKRYINKHFKDNWGSVDYFIYPIDHLGAKKWLNNFIKTRLQHFGKYEDAFHSNIKFGYHSILSPLLNIGLLTDNDILESIFKLYNNKIPSNSLEGYIRQIVGWKQSMRYLYQFHYEKFHKKNFLNHKRKISKSFWEGNTGIPPVDNCIKKVFKYGYLHHIERLMIMGQFFLLTMVNPDDVYDWFISIVSIDSYAWVMVPNIYGMIMYADGGFMMSRPYFSSSNYIKKMSDYKSNKDTILINKISYQWDEIWDALYYNFINTHYKILKKNYFIARNIAHWDKKTKKEKDHILFLANAYLKVL